MTERSIALRPRKPPFFATPWLRVTVPILLGILANVFAGAYIFEITRTLNNEPFLAWKETYHSIGFWCLVGIAVVAGIYTRWTLAYERKRDTDILRFRDKDYILSIPFEAQTRSRVAEIDSGKNYTFAELEEMVFGREAKR